MNADADAVTLQQRATPSDQVPTRSCYRRVGGELMLLDLAGER